MSDGYLNYDAIRVPLAECTVEQLVRQQELATQSSWVDRNRWLAVLRKELDRRSREQVGGGQGAR